MNGKGDKKKNSKKIKRIIVEYVGKENFWERKIKKKLRFLRKRDLREN